jgi:hypothetical protein
MIEGINLIRLCLTFNIEYAILLNSSERFSGCPARRLEYIKQKAFVLKAEYKKVGYSYDDENCEHDVQNAEESADEEDRVEGLFAPDAR